MVYWLCCPAAHGSSESNGKHMPIIAVFATCDLNVMCKWYWFWCSWVRGDWQKTMIVARFVCMVAKCKHDSSRVPSDAVLNIGEQPCLSIASNDPFTKHIPSLCYAAWVSNSIICEHLDPLLCSEQHWPCSTLPCILPKVMLPMLHKVASKCNASMWHIGKGHGPLEILWPPHSRSAQCHSSNLDHQHNRQKRWWPLICTSLAALMWHCLWMIY